MFGKDNFLGRILNIGPKIKVHFVCKFCGDIVTKKHSCEGLKQQYGSDKKVNPKNSKDADCFKAVVVRNNGDKSNSIMQYRCKYCGDSVTGPHSCSEIRSAFGSTKAISPYDKDSSDFLTSLVVAKVSDSALLGYLAGGSVGGSLLGSSSEETSCNSFSGNDSVFGDFSNGGGGDYPSFSDSGSGSDNGSGNS